MGRKPWRELIFEKENDHITIHKNFEKNNLCLVTGAKIEPFTVILLGFQQK